MIKATKTFIYRYSKTFRNPAIFKRNHTHDVELVERLPNFAQSWKQYAARHKLISNKNFSIPTTFVSVKILPRLRGFD